MSKHIVDLKYRKALALQAQGMGYGRIAKTLGYAGKSSVQYLLNKYPKTTTSTYRASVVLVNPDGSHKTISTIAESKEELSENLLVIANQMRSEL